MFYMRMLHMIRNGKIECSLAVVPKGSQQKHIDNWKIMQVK